MLNKYDIKVKEINSLFKQKCCPMAMVLVIVKKCINSYMCRMVCQGSADLFIILYWRLRCKLQVLQHLKNRQIQITKFILQR